MPTAVVKAKCAPYLKLGKPEHRPERVQLGDHEIVSIYGAEYRGIVQYYLLAGDVWRLSRLHWVMLTSMLKTLAAKHRSTVTAMARKHKTTIATPYGPRRCFEARVERDGRKPLVARFGGIPLRRQKKAVLTDRHAVPGATRSKGKELITRLRAGRCELCEQPAKVRVHQVRKLADLASPGRPQPAWAQLMASGERPSWSARPATTPSTRGSQPRHPRDSHRRAVMRGKPARPVRVGGRRKRTRARRHLADGLPTPGGA